MYVNESISNKFHLDCGVPQGSSLGQLLFNTYASKLFYIINYRLPDVHCSADDSQLYLSFSPKGSTSQEAAVSSQSGGSGLLPVRRQRSPPSQEAAVSSQSGGSGQRIRMLYRGHQELNVF